MSSSFSEQHPAEDPGYTDRPIPTVRKPEPVGLPALGSLAQKARGKQLDRARAILLVVGILTILANGVMMFTIRDSVTKEIDKELAKNNLTRARADRAQLQQIEDEAVLTGMVISGVAVALGFLFVIFGLIVKKFPVPVTITSLVLYLVANIGFGVLDPTTLAQAIILKIIVVVVLVKAIQAAQAYEKEAREAAAAMELGY